MNIPKVSFLFWHKYAITKWISFGVTTSMTFNKVKVQGIARAECIGGGVKQDAYVQFSST